MTSSSSKQTITYTLTDEAPALATYSFLPIVKAFTRSAGIQIETKDISLAARILAYFPDYLSDTQKTSDALNELGELVKQDDTNIIKLPNISASIPQLKAAIKELQTKGYPLPDYPDTPENKDEKEIQASYDKVKGSAVNPVLREGNSDRRAPGAVKKYAQNNPHSMGQWQADSKTHVSSMTHGDFYDTENSITLDRNGQFKIELISKKNKTVLLKDYAPFLQGEIIDSAVMSKSALREFFIDQIKSAKTDNILLSLHLKATMMKVSDPIIFGHAVSVYFQTVFATHQAVFDELGVNVNNGLGDLLVKLKQLPQQQQRLIKADIQHCLDTNAELAMVNSEQGITNLHVPSDIIIDASMPAAIRSSGKMWGRDGKLHDTKALIPDRCYAGIYQETINFCKQHGAFDPASMGTVQNVGLMAQKAEEYGSHDKTFAIPHNGIVRVVDEDGTCLLEQNVEQGDIWRMCQVKDAAIQDWVKLAVNRARTTKLVTIFWLDDQRAHDSQLISKVKASLKHYDTSDLDIRIMSPQEAINFSLNQIKQGEDCISVTGNVLRDYLTDLFPILELGTSAKMLSIVPLMNGGGLFETGAGGSAPKHVQQLLKENHLRWDSLGEFLALSVSLEQIASHYDNKKAQILAQTLDQATAEFLQKNKSPSRHVGEIDNRGSHFYLALYWAQALAEQSSDLELQAHFSVMASELSNREQIIIAEINSLQGNSVDLKGYYHPDRELIKQIMRPSKTFNLILL
ncbi:MAG: NADP-dependent isocitrate dehydrogenase [gamma proteobacterium symbiont of Taylorina sp.]|nr:NADP-dependent isocitrate dehydrogenase [gamma proteobacterium symbiont of Taylorina sp.]